MSDSLSSPSSPDAGAVIVAAGSGTRMGSGGPRKQYLELLGEPVLLWAVRPFLEHPRVAETVVVLPAADAAEPPSWLARLPVRIVAGGAVRSDSVRHGLEALGGGPAFVLIHDGARPLVSREVIDRVLAGAGQGGAVAGVRVTDTVKEATSDGRVSRTLDRRALWQAQTPQAFPLAAILDAHRRAAAEGFSPTDDAGLCERYGIAVRLVEGAYENIKVTRPLDLVLAEALARRLRAG